MSQPDATEKMIVKGLNVIYSTKQGNFRAVENVSFEIPRGQSIGIVGESGSGKSTLGLSILRSLPDNGFTESGTILLENEDILSIPSKKFDEFYRWKKISMIFQGSMNSLDPVFNIENQMKEILKVHKAKDKDKGRDYNTIIKNAISSVGLDPGTVSKRFPHELSGGMKQRIVIANALLLEPSILIADEPTTALDVVTQFQIISNLKKMKDSKNMKIIMITHDLSIIKNLVDKVVIMYAGQAVEISDTNTIFSKPLHPYTQALIKSIPKINSKDNKIQFIKGDPPDIRNINQGCRFKDRCSKVMEVCNNEPPDISIDGNQVKC
ncbi:MAG: ABC transporter ATP-binding protein, partial [Thermoproteota archaeon]|nr:ABC transporter ATP-binding protein [Thermoproteota archaeon]